MENLIVGEDHCEITKLVLSISSCAVFSDLREKFTTLSRLLNTDVQKRNQISKQLDRGDITLQDALEAIISEWQLRESKEATLGRFMQILEDAQMNLFADRLKEDFRKLCNQKPLREKSIENHILYYIDDLVNGTVLTSDLLERLQTAEVLGQESTEHLLSIKHCARRNERFYQIVMEKIRKEGETLYDKLIKVFIDADEECHNTVLCLLTRYFD